MEQRRQRREKIADFMRETWDMRAACQRFRVSESLVRQSCAEFGVKCDEHRDGRRIGITLAILADIIHATRGQTLTDIAKKHNAPLPRVSKIFHEAHKYGIPLGPWKLKNLGRQTRAVLDHKQAVVLEKERQARSTETSSD